MKKYEAVFILNPDLKEEELKVVSGQINDAVAKHNGAVTISEVWQARRKLTFPIKKFKDGIYYRLNFTLDPKLASALRQTYQLNEKILRVMITTDFMAVPVQK